MQRDIEPGLPRRRSDVRVGRSIIAVVGIDRYVEWPRLDNAVSDAIGVSRLFTQLGFVELTPPLLDGAATCEAMRRLVTDDLANKLSRDDSLVLFFAGHGHTHISSISEVSVTTGCVIPVDATRRSDSISASWLRLDSWLSDIARLRPRHILVIIDACHSGIALDRLHRAEPHRDAGAVWRGGDMTMDLSSLLARRSRQIITSALDDQRAMDSGPIPGHSLFTGCLIEALSRELAEGGTRFVTGREIGMYVQKRVSSYSKSMQTPDFGSFELDDRGDIAVPILAEAADPSDPVEVSSGGSGESSPEAGSDARTAALRRVRLEAAKIDARASFTGAPPPAPPAGSSGRTARRPQHARIAVTVAIVSGCVALGYAALGSVAGSESPDAQIIARTASSTDASSPDSRPSSPAADASPPDAPLQNTPRRDAPPHDASQRDSALPAPSRSGASPPAPSRWNTSRSNASRPTEPTGPASEIVMTQPPPDSIKLLQSGVISSILAKDDRVQEGQTILILHELPCDGAKFVRLQKELMTRYEEALEELQLARQSGDTAAQTAIRAEIDDLKQRLVDVVERKTSSANPRREAMTADLCNVAIKAPSGGRFSPVAKVGETVTAGTLVAKLQRDAAPMAAFSVANVEGFVSSGKATVSVDGVAVPCTVAEIKSGRIKVECPFGVIKGDRVTLMLPR